ncbi:MAG: hypothetical protein H0U04_11550 [Rubrobacter sp.]|nr:hypothetical protein [Rubrobacter sp.]
MSTRTAAQLAWSLCALSLALMVLALLLLILGLSHPGTPVYDPWLDNTVTTISYAPVGALIASRRPENPVGWLLCLFGLAISSSFFSAEYAIYALLVQPGSLPVGEAGAWIASWMLPVIIGLSVFPLLLFPTGRLPSRRWRWSMWLTAAFVLVGVLSAAFSSGAAMGALGPIRNPLGIQGFTSVYKAVLFTVPPLLLVAAALSLFVRLRRAVGTERQQIKWFAYAAAASVGATNLAYLIPGVLDTPLWFERVGFALNIASIPAIPGAIGIAILLHRLYDIDRIINRTLVYAIVSATLAVVYFGGIVLSQRIFTGLTGQENLPQLAIVASTLVIAALFNPLRRRVQSFIDRRFYRRKYDARQTLEAFSAKLRDETDLEALNKELVEVVRETMQPAQVSLWLRPDTASRSRQAG